MIIPFLLINFKTYNDNEESLRKIPLPLSILIGGILGFVSGVVGIGGGIFLSPILFLLRAAKTKVIITTASVFILINSLSGIIGFVGLVIPHLVRLIGGAKHEYVLIGSVLLGSSIMIFADLVSRTIILPAELPVGLITSAIGAPFFLWLIFRIQNK